MISQEARKLAEAARALNAAHPAGLRAGGPCPALFFLTDEARTPDPLAAIACLPEGCGVVFRHYGAPDRAALAADVVEACHAEGRLVLVGGDARLAREVGAEGVHLPERMFRLLTERPDAAMVTAAAHDGAAIARAAKLGLDAVFLSPVFATASHSGAPSLGAETFGALVRAAKLPVYGLGGISAANADNVASSGAVGLAAIGGLLGP